MSSPISFGLSIMMEPEFARAALPLFESEKVEILEWSFDADWDAHRCPPWVEIILSEYSAAGRLLGHGVSYSLFTAGNERHTAFWLERLRDETRNRRYEHISEHFGFMLAGDFHRGAPLPLPLTPETLSLGREKLDRLSQAAQLPVGLENLAFAFCRDDVVRQGEFLDNLLDPLGGFVLLDLHNIYCQSWNFGIPPNDLLDAYPLHRVREIHISGGSWSEVDGASVRRDTHDGPIPKEVFDLLDITLDRCSAIRAVIFEHLGTEFHGDEAIEAFRQDFNRAQKIIHERTAVTV